MPTITLKILSTAQSGASGRGDVALFSFSHMCRLHQTGYAISRCQVLCVSCWSCPVLHFSVVNVFFWYFAIIDSSNFKCWKLSTAQVGARGHKCMMLQFLLSLMNILNQTESACYMLWLMIPKEYPCPRYF
jgi:hypothetical protein